MSGLGVLVVIVFVILAVMDNLRRVGKGTTVPRGGARLPQSEGSTRPYPRVGGTRPHTTEETAETLLPEDLWALLTGQQRPPAPSPAPRPAALPAPGEQEETDLEHAASLEEASFEAVSARGETERGDTATLPLSAAPAAAPVAPPPSPPPAGPARVALRGRQNLRRAMQLQVILGPPRSLE